MAALTAEEEAIIRHRFLTQTTVSKGEPPFKRLAKRYLQFCQALETGTEDAAQEHYRILIKDLGLIEFQTHKLKFQSEAFQQEQQLFVEKQAHLDEEIAKARQTIEARQQELQEAKVWRRQQEEYEALKKLVMEHPQRTVTEQAIAKLQGELGGVRAESEAAQLALERRRKQFSLLLHCVEELQRSLEEDAAADASEEGALMGGSASDGHLAGAGQAGRVDTPEPMAIG